MQYPTFFNSIKPIILQDDLAQFLGASQDGILEFSYLDVVKSAGHSCPTVLGAYLMTQAALHALYDETLPQRGNIKVSFKEDVTEGVTGVVSNVMKNITGATELEGFKGLAGNYDRRHLLSFNQDIDSNVRFTRRDINQSVDVYYDASNVSANGSISTLMQKCLSKTATIEEQTSFKNFWQERVKNIYDRKDEVIRVELVKA